MNEDLKRWDDIADEWVNRIIPKGKLSDYLTKPTLLKILGEVLNKKILDVGCGNGRFIGFLQSKGAKAVGVDGSPKMIEFARKAYPQIEFRVCDINNALPFNGYEFDAVISNNLLMSVENVEGFLKECARVMKADGMAVISVLHPAFNQPTMDLYKTFIDKLFFRRPKGLAFDYFQSKTIRREGNATMGMAFYHRTLEQYTQLFSQAGLMIERIYEPRITDPAYLKENPKIEYSTRLPRFIFFKLVKHS